MSEEGAPPAPDLAVVYELMLSLSRACLIISLADAQAVAAELSRMDALMPILDPTGYRAILPQRAGHARFIAAFVAFRRELEALREEGGA
mgnify:FL=1